MISVWSELATLHIMEFLAVFLYFILAVFSGIGTVLYTYAYINMKNTSIIGAVAVMLCMIALDALWWGFAEFCHFTNDTYPELFIHPLAIMIIKLLLVVGVLFFVVISVKIKKDPIKCKNKIK